MHMKYNTNIYYRQGTEKKYIYITPEKYLTKTLFMGFLVQITNKLLHMFKYDISYPRNFCLSLFVVHILYGF